MQSLQIDSSNEFPFPWVNLNRYPDSGGFRNEIYLVSDEEVLDNLIVLFYNLFGDIKAGIKIYAPSWWDFCLDTWNIESDEYDYTLNGKSVLTVKYLNLLKESSIQIGYAGSCTCLNWDSYLHTTVGCILNHTAPYSPIFYHEGNQFFFYFHHTGSVGLYYKEANDTIRGILAKADAEYDVK